MVAFDLIAEIEAFQDYSQSSLEDEMSDRLAFDKILLMIEDLPPRCRQIMKLRKLEDWPQKQIAAHLGISEKTVEAQVRLGLRAIRLAWDMHNEAERHVPRAVARTGA